MNKDVKAEMEQCLLNKNLTILGEIKTTNDKVYCKTKEGYEVLALPSSILRRNDSPEVFSVYNPYTISNIKKWLNLNNVNLSLISDTYVSSNAKLEWICGNCNKVFESPWKHIQGGKKFCNYCARSKRYDGYRDYFGIIKDECDKCEYELLTLKINRSTDIFNYICKKHKEYGVQHSTYDLMIRNKKHCRYCGIERRGIKHRFDESSVRNIVEEKGFIFCGIDYEYSSQERKRGKILVKCKKHQHKGIQKMDFNNIKNGNGRCIYCTGKYRTKDDLQNEIDEAKLNIEIINYSDYSSPILAKCRNCKKEWTTNGSNLAQGVGCPNCNKSKFEKEVQCILEKHNIKYISQYRIKDCKDKNPLPFDFYLCDKNILIEVDGEGHYKPIKRTSSMTEEEAIKQLKAVQYHDNIKDKYCLENNLRLIRIPYWERKNVENYILEKVS